MRQDKVKTEIVFKRFLITYRMAKYKFCTVALIECFRLDAVTCSHCVCDTTLLMLPLN